MENTVSRQAISDIAKDSIYVVHPKLRSKETRRLNRSMGIRELQYR